MELKYIVSQQLLQSLKVSGWNMKIANVLGYLVAF
jgi:hypothetical protein